MGKRNKLSACVYDPVFIEGGALIIETVYIAGGCLWGVQHFFDSLPGVIMTEAGRANGKTNFLDGPYEDMQSV